MPTITIDVPTTDDVTWGYAPLQNGYYVIGIWDGITQVQKVPSLSSYPSRGEIDIARNREKVLEKIIASAIRRQAWEEGRRTPPAEAVIL